MQGFPDLCEFIAVPLAQENTMGPCTNIIFLGLEIDTSDMVVRIPPEKIQQLTALLTSSLIKKISPASGNSEYCWEFKFF